MKKKYILTIAIVMGMALGTVLTQVGHAAYRYFIAVPANVQVELNLDDGLDILSGVVFFEAIQPGDTTNTKEMTIQNISNESIKGITVQSNGLPNGLTLASAIENESLAPGQATTIFVNVHSEPQLAPTGDHNFIIEIRATRQP